MPGITKGCGLEHSPTLYPPATFMQPTAHTSERSQGLDDIRTIDESSVVGRVEDVDACVVCPQITAIGYWNVPDTSIVFASPVSLTFDALARFCNSS